MDCVHVEELGCVKIKRFLGCIEHFREVSLSKVRANDLVDPVLLGDFSAPKPSTSVLGLFPGLVVVMVIPTLFLETSTLLNVPSASRLRRMIGAMCYPLYEDRFVEGLYGFLFMIWHQVGQDRA